VDCAGKNGPGGRKQLNKTVVEAPAIESLGECYNYESEIWAVVL
jgi:hypothetical protein